MSGINKSLISPQILLLFISVIIISAILSFTGCKKETKETPSQETSFKLISPAIGPDSLLPAEFTCDGSSSSLPLAWSGYPAETQYFALIMHHVASPADIHWYWVLYNIPVNVTSLPENVQGIGLSGTNSVNSRNEYAPPCSQGPGRKDYILTIYALSEMAEPPVPEDQLNRDVLLEAIKDITLSSASMTVWYSRNIK